MGLFKPPATPVRHDYDTTGLIEAQFEPGSRGRVLKNLRGITRKREMDRIEGEEQLRALRKLIAVYGRNHRFTAADIREIHKAWLGTIYEWAGMYRRVNISKAGFLFAAAAQIPSLMKEFEMGPLREYTPCTFSSIEKVTQALALVHTELVLIHPFREGNGRVARMLSTLIALQAGLPPLNFSGIRGQRRKEYFAAVQAGLDRNYEPMKAIFSGVIRRKRAPHEPD
jgi:cell filamentation protein